MGCLILAATGPGLGGVPGSPHALLPLATRRRYYQPGYYRRIAGLVYGGAARRDPDALLHGTFAALDQRIATRYAIKPMDLAESAAYLRHHMTLAGREEPLFADDATARLHRVSSGLPRALNNAATAALIAAAAAGQDLVDDACAKKAVAELTRG